MGCLQSSEAIKQNADGSVAPSAPASTGAQGKLLEKYTLGKVLGQGAFGIVYSCKKKGTKEEYAVKMIDKVETPLQEIKQEAEMLAKLKHPSVVALHDVFYEKAFVCMVMDLYKGGDMIEGMQLHWKALGMLPISVVANVSKQMIDSIAWLHQNSVVHRDVKGDNYLMDRKNIEDPGCRIFLSDFGTVRDLTEGQRLQSKCGTKTYWAPEFFAMNYGLKVDVWAIGVVMYGLVTGRFPFKGEDDVKNKRVMIPPRSSQQCGDLLKKVLERNESQRLSAQAAQEHPFVVNAKSAGGPKEVSEKMDFKPDVRESSPNAGVDQRRKELVDRLDNAAGQKKEPMMKLEELKSADKFTVEDRNAEKKTTFQWWSAQKCKDQDIVTFTGARPLLEDAQAEVTAKELEQMLTQHKVEVGLFGTGKAKTFDAFLNEIQTGSSRILLDATQFKSIVRVVDVVLLRILCKTKDGTKYLVKMTEQFPDGRVKKEMNQLPGTKKEPHENAMQTALRIVQDRLALKDCQIKFDFANAESFEEDEDSPSYPGVRTVYRKEIYEGTITTTDPKVLQRIGVTGSGSWTNLDSKGYTRTFHWFSLKQCEAQKVKLKANQTQGNYSALVHAPVGIGEEALQSFLESNKVDISKFGQGGNKSLKEFSDELSKGEATLSQQADGSVSRVVDVVILKVVRGSDILVEHCEESKDGKKKMLNWLPGVKRRPDENMFLAAHRAIAKVLKINDNFISLSPQDVLVVEEQKASPAYCGLMTIYKKRIITAQVLDRDTSCVL